VTTGHARPRHRHLLGLLALGVAVAGVGVACSGDDSTSPSDTVNFTGSGTAQLELAGETTTFTVSCESTDLGGTGTLLISGSGPPGTSGGAAVGLEVRVQLGSSSGTVSANLGGEPPVVVTSSDAEVTFDGATLGVSSPYTDTETGRAFGDGTLTVEGCRPD
jgi:hypothetical protein